MQTNDGGALFNGLDAVGGAYDDRLCTERHHHARASSMELTVPSISGTLCGSRTNPVIMYTRSFSFTASHSTCAACIVRGSPV